LKDQGWTWKEVAIVVGLVFATIGLAIITLWILWNNPLSCHDNPATGQVLEEFVP
jgi:hypothetical protein